MVEYNVYCDESCHLEHDNSNVMVIGAVYCPKKMVKKINKDMLKLSSKRSQLKKRWEDSLAVYDKIEIVEETEVKEEFITVVMFMDALRTLCHF